MNQRIAHARALGPKFVLVGALAILLWIPCLMIYVLVLERSSRAEDARNEIYKLVGGQQTISGPVLITPAIVDTGRVGLQGAPITHRISVVFTPQTLTIDGAVDASIRKRSIFDATIYQAELSMKGRFGPLNPPRIPEGVATFLWDETVIAIGFPGDGSLKGVKSGPKLLINGEDAAVKFEPGVTIEQRESPAVATTGVSALLPNTDPAKGFSFDIAMTLSGGGALNFSPVGEETVVNLSSDWPHPSFQGARLPDQRTIDAKGFSAAWRVPYLSRSLQKSFIAEGGLQSLDAGNSFGVSFVAVDGPYQSVNRSLKYALLFVGIIFLTFFLIEATMGGQAHPAQYILLGMAQVIFYLLVLAFAEHIGFETAFIGAAIATVLLSGVYAATVFHSLWKGLIAFFAFSGAYCLIYLLMKSEDYALLIGSVAAYGAVALTMTVTRKLDWYGATMKEGRP